MPCWGGLALAKVSPWKARLKLIVAAGTESTVPTPEHRTWLTTLRTSTTYASLAYTSFVAAGLRMAGSLHWATGIVVWYGASV